eukprot:6212477-Pleurochrysis_carterae.AAC.2
MLCLPASSKDVLLSVCRQNIRHATVILRRPLLSGRQSETSTSMAALNSGCLGHGQRFHFKVHMAQLGRV